MRTYRALLVNAPNPHGENVSGNYSVFPAMGVVTLATKLKRRFGESLDISTIDGGLHSREEILGRIDALRPDMVGISVLTPTYTEGLMIARHAKDQGATTVLGADHACFFPELILANRPCVDHVAEAEDETDSLTYLIQQELGVESVQPTGGPERLFGRIQGSPGVIASFPRFQLKDTNQGSCDVPDLDFIKDDLPVFASNYNARYGKFHTSPRTPAVINNVRGCSNGQAKKRCTYCSIWDLMPNAGRPEYFWDAVDAYARHGVNMIFEVCDSFLTFRSYASKLRDQQRFSLHDRDIELEVYARANDIVSWKPAIDTLQALNVTRVNLGIDSGDDTMLRLLRKHNEDDALSPSQVNYTAIERLVEAGITVHASFPLGSLGETPDSLQTTVEFIERIASDFPGHLATLEASELIPLPHSPAWDLLVSNEQPMFDFRLEGGLEQLLADAHVSLTENQRNELQRRHAGTDLLSIDALATDWITHFTHVSPDEIAGAKRVVAGIADRIGAAYGRAI